MSGNIKRRSNASRSKRIYILPNLFTSASLFGGFYAVIASMQGRFEAAAIAIILAAICDGLDGRIARITGTASDFGKEYDSLSDLVSFGVAPAVLAYLWALKPFGRLGWLAAFMYTICGALRLARFNVETARAKSIFFKGLPIPAAAFFIASLILFAGDFPEFFEKRHIVIIIMIYALSFLMVSSLNYFSFKEINVKNHIPFSVLVASILILLIIAYKPKILLFHIVFLYILSGPAVTLYRHYKKRKAGKEYTGNSGENHDPETLKNR